MVSRAKLADPPTRLVQFGPVRGVVCGRLPDVLCRALAGPWSWQQKLTGGEEMAMMIHPVIMMEIQRYRHADLIAEAATSRMVADARRAYRIGDDRAKRPWRALRARRRPLVSNTARTA